MCGKYTSLFPFAWRRLGEEGDLARLLTFCCEFDTLPTLTALLTAEEGESGLRDVSASLTSFEGEPGLDGEPCREAEEGDEGFLPF